MILKKILSSMFKKYKLFSSISVVTDILRFKIVHFFANFRPLQLQSRDWVPPNLMLIQPLSASKLRSNFSVPH